MNFEGINFGEKEIINDHCYITRALTDCEGKIYGIIKDCCINKWDLSKAYYWSYVLVFGNRFSIVHKGMLLYNNVTDEKLCKLHKQSQINLN